MYFGRYGTARWLAASCFALMSCGGTAVPVTQPTVPVPVPGAAPVAVGPAQPVAAPGKPAAAPATEREAPPPVATAAISGRVLTAEATPLPLARARVILISEALPESRATITRADGGFTFEKLPPGNYELFASASGYAPQQYAQRRNAQPPPVAVVVGQQVTGIDIELPHAGVIVGQVLDEDQKPFVGAIVEALVSKTVDNKASFVAMSTAQTDDRGQFRLAGLPAGQYYVGARDPAFENVGDETGPLRYSPTYYPGVPTVDEATRVTVTPGVEPTGRLVFPLRIIRPAHVSGIIATVDRMQLLSGAVIMSPVRAESIGVVPSDDVDINPDGTFTFRNVAPGNYQIRARAEIDPEGVALFATFRTPVRGNDLRNIDMVLHPGAVVRGRLIFAGKTARPPKLEGIRVRAPFADGSSFGDALTGDVAADASYAIRGLMPGKHFFSVEGLPEPWVLNRVLLRGQDVTDLPIEVNNSQVFDEVHVELSDAGSLVTGIVRDARGRPVPDALVIVIPSASQFWTRASRRFGLIATDAQGRYRLRGLPTGDYRAVASVELDESEVFQRDLLNDLLTAGIPVSVTEGQSRTLHLGLTSMLAMKRTSER